MIGDLSTRVVLSRPERAVDAGGGAALSFMAVATVWASLSSPGADETQARGASVTVLRHRLRIRRRDDVAPGWRASWEGREARVVAVRDLNAGGRWLTLDCEEEQD